MAADMEHVGGISIPAEDMRRRRTFGSHHPLYIYFDISLGSLGPEALIASTPLLVLFSHGPRSQTKRKSK